MKAVARGVRSLPKALLPFPPEFVFGVSAEVKQLHARMDDAFASLEGLSWSWDPDSLTGVGHADGNVWSRASRRKGHSCGEDTDVMMDDAERHDADKKEDDEDGDEDDEEEEEKAIRFEIALRSAEGAGPGAGEVEVKIRWVEGLDHVLFESFCGMVKRKLST